MKKTLRYLLWLALALLLTTALAVFLIVRIALAPAATEWSTRVQLGPLGFDVGVPTAIRVATAPWFGPWLAGRSIRSAYGPVRLDWQEADKALVLNCAPCSISLPELGAKPIEVEHLRITAQRDTAWMKGQLEAKTADARAPLLQGHWQGRLSQQGLPVHIEIDAAPISEWYAVFVPELPELRRAQIGGTLALQAQLELPARNFSLQPHIRDFSVSGLGTEAMLNTLSGCGAPARLSAQSWLARAVIAAEDQRFFQHPGYDLAELGAALAANQKNGQITRGGSTLTQQLAKLVATGSERSGERKLRELLYAVEMERTLGKARILQLYLDQAPWGGEICGAEAAAQRYFKRSAARLQPAQAVWLASMLHKPSAELMQWQRSGQIDLARAQRVAEGVRGISRRQREALLQEVAASRFAPP